MIEWRQEGRARKWQREETNSVFAPVDGWNNAAKSCLPSNTPALLSGMGARVMADGGGRVEEHPEATLRYEKAFVWIWPSSPSSFSLYPGAL